ncbi:DUF1992 domain-containing protein [Thalassobacillus devorans]|uniref:DUF1992 domain-containing protein n=1 Tax=Thalassobacillus devorans TaxID=279813 RepID=A0ABQ1PW49_9BACI|nr:DUF1992 domain-containing protein [Thalassobacillus devorans]NIK30849.1 hypothetical protein [Thalassobacillus devorans]GGD04751.1 DUF1992 domain-containing protein [Thalassobacillus devorans]
MDFTSIVEEKIKQSIRSGDFDNLPGKGKPLPKDDMEHVPADLRNSYKILKNANMIPEEMQLKKEIVSLEELVDCCREPEEKARYMQQLSEKQLRFQLIMEQRKLKNSGVFRRYRGQINRKMGF